MPHITMTSRTRRGAAASLVGIAIGLAAVTGAGPVPSLFQLTGATADVRGSCDEPEHATDAACAANPAPRGVEDGSTSSTVDDRTSTTPSTVGQLSAPVTVSDDGPGHDVGDDHSVNADGDDVNDDRDADDSSGPGSGSDHSLDDSSGPGSGSDDRLDDSSGSGHGSDDVNDDSLGHGSDDGPGHD
jgi:hypothetical protein